MSIVKSKEIHLVSRPNGEPLAENFLVKEVEIKEVKENEILVKNLWMSVDPYMRGRMIDRKSYVPPFELGKHSKVVLLGLLLNQNAKTSKKEISLILILDGGNTLLLKGNIYKKLTLI